MVTNRSSPYARPVDRETLAYVTGLTNFGAVPGSHTHPSPSVTPRNVADEVGGIDPGEPRRGS